MQWAMLDALADATTTTATDPWLWTMSTGTSTTTRYYTNTAGTTGGTITLAALKTMYNARRQPARVGEVIELGQSGVLELPDGARLEYDADGSYRMIDADARVTYRACRFREFNRFLNASDLLEEFISDAGALGARQSDMMQGALALFVNWLVLKAAEADGDTPPPDVPALADHPILKQLKAA
jgi:hypothetical protein